MCNPYCKKTEAEYHRLYAEGKRDGTIDRTAGNGAKGSRRWKEAYRWGYSDGYCGR